MPQVGEVCVGALHVMVEGRKQSNGVPWDKQVHRGLADAVLVPGGGVLPVAVPDAGAARRADEQLGRQPVAGQV